MAENKRLRRLVPELLRAGLILGLALALGRVIQWLSLRDWVLQFITKWWWLAPPGLLLALFIGQWIRAYWFDEADN